jgi:hypothetical protein
LLSLCSSATFLSSLLVTWVLANIPLLADFVQSCAQIMSWWLKTYLTSIVRSWWSECVVMAACTTLLFTMKVLLVWHFVSHSHS